MKRIVILLLLTYAYSFGKTSYYIPIGITISYCFNKTIAINPKIGFGIANNDNQQYVSMYEGSLDFINIIKKLNAISLNIRYGYQNNKIQIPFWISIGIYNEFKNLAWGCVTQCAVGGLLGIDIILITPPSPSENPYLLLGGHLNYPLSFQD